MFKKVSQSCKRLQQPISKWRHISSCRPSLASRKDLESTTHESNLSKRPPGKLLRMLSRALLTPIFSRCMLRCTGCNSVVSTTNGFSFIHRAGGGLELSGPRSMLRASFSFLLFQRLLPFARLITFAQACSTADCFSMTACVVTSATGGHQTHPHCTANHARSSLPCSHPSLENIILTCAASPINDFVFAFTLALTLSFPCPCPLSWHCSVFFRLKCGPSSAQRVSD